jgi:quinol monooxygenase YgiN
MEGAMRSLFLVVLFLLGLAASAQPAASADVRLFVRHEVNDYAAWRKVYNDFDKPRRNLGVTAQAVYRSAENPNDVTVTHDFKSMEQAKAFVSSPDLKAAMEKAGIKGAPQIWITTRAAK